MENSKENQFDPKEFLDAKVISPLEQEKLLGGTAEAVEKETVREHVKES
ncbi:hypothetical protein [Pedobacter cryoconitis]|nr:hypothetical protein [Pedobacter cryoconitis]